MSPGTLDQPAIRDPSPRHLPALDGLRGLAALSVVLGHLSEFGFSDWIPGGTKDYGVVLFFSLSGFLMGHLYLRRECSAANAWKFVVARVARIVPIYFLVVLVSFFIYHTVDHHFVYDVSGRQLVRLLTFNGSTSVFWSVGPEFQFYMVFLGLWWMWDQPRLRGLAVAAAIVLCVVGVAWNARLPGILFLSKAHIFLFGIAASIALRALWDRPRMTPIRLVLQFLSVASLIMLAIPNPWAPRIYSLLAPHSDPKMSLFYGSPLVSAWAAVVVLSLGWGSRIINGIFASRALVLLGEISFSVYLLHDAVLWLLETVNVQHEFGMFGGSVIAVCLSLAVAVVANRFIEVPSRNLLRDKLSTLSKKRILLRPA